MGILSLSPRPRGLELGDSESAMAIMKALFMTLVSLQLFRSNVSAYPQNYSDVVEGSGFSGPSGKFSLEGIVPENLTSMVTDTTDKGLDLFNQLYDTANTVVDGIIGFGRKLEDISFNIYNSVAGGPGKNGKSSSAVDLDGKIDELLNEAQKEWKQGDFRNKKYDDRLEYDIRSGIQEGRDTVLNLVKMVSEKAKEVEPAISQGVVDIADETKDLQKKAEPLIDTILKVNEVIKSPEFRSFMDEMDNIGKSFDKLSGGSSCKWNYARERYVTFDSSKAWVDEEFVRCRLEANGWNRYDDQLVNEIQGYTGKRWSVVERYLRYQALGY